jgi:hypothetical protein
MYFFIRFSWLKAYRSMFPPELKTLKSEPEILARSMFKLLEIENTLLFPVVRKKEKGATVDWFPGKSTEQQAFFGPAETKNRIQNVIGQFLMQDSAVDVILIDLGFNLVHGLFDDLVDIMSSAGSTHHYNITCNIF